MNGYERWLSSKKAGQITIDDEFARQRNPDWEWTRQQQIDNLLNRAAEREQVAKFYDRHYNTLATTNLRQCAENDRALAAMLRR